MYILPTYKPVDEYTYRANKKYYDNYIRVGKPGIIMGDQFIPSIDKASHIPQTMFLNHGDMALGNEGFVPGGIVTQVSGAVKSASEGKFTPGLASSGKIVFDFYIPSGMFTLEFWLKGVWPSAHLISMSDPYYMESMTEERQVFDITANPQLIGLIENTFNAEGGRTYINPLNSSDALSPNDWHHFAYVFYAYGAPFSGNYVQAFTDGKAGPIKGPKNGSYPHPWGEKNTLTIDLSDGAPAYSGFVSELRISSLPRYQDNFTPPTAPFTQE